MKKTISAIIMLLTLFCVCSCSENEVQTSGFFASNAYHNIIETPTRVLLMDGKLIYYNKVDGNSYKFCFDPLCSNVYPEGKCPYVMIAPTPLASTIVYCEKNARFYAARGQKICSMGFDAGEIRTECSLGEDGNLNSVDYDRNYIKNLRCAGDYLFFLYKDDVTGHNKLMRYSIKTGDLVPLTSAENEWMIGYEIADGYIFCKMLDENNNIVFYTADYDFDNLHIVSDPVNPNSFGSSMGVYDGKYFYSLDSSGGALWAIDPLRDEKKLVSNNEIFTGNVQLMAVNNGEIYFIKAESRRAGYVQRQSGKAEISTTFNSVYRIDSVGGITCIYSNPRCEIRSLNFIDGGAVLDCASVYVDGDDGYIKNVATVYLLCDISHSGEFVKPKPIGSCSERLSADDISKPVS